MTAYTQKDMCKIVRNAKRACLFRIDGTWKLIRPARPLWNRIALRLRWWAKPKAKRKPCGFMVWEPEPLQSKWLCGQLIKPIVVCRTLRPNWRGKLVMVDERIGMPDGSLKIKKRRWWARRTK